MAGDTSKQFDLSITLGDATFQASGESTLVMKALGEFKALVEAGPKPRRQAAPKNGRPDDASGGEAADISEPLAVFAKRNWSNQAAKATAIVMWAKKNENKNALKPSEIETRWRKTSGKVPANLPQVCKTAETSGWLHNEGKGQYAVTGHGEEMVNATAKSA